MKTHNGQPDTQSMDLIAEHYLAKYKGYVDIFESKNAKARAGVNVSSADIVAFGMQLDQWNAYRDFCESNGTLGELGPMPKIALDVVAAVQTKNILPLISSTQPIDEMQGIVYAKKLVAVKGADTKTGMMGGVTQGQTLNSSLNGDRVADPYFGGSRQFFTAAAPFVTTASSTATYTKNIGMHLLPETVRLELVDTAKNIKFVWMDDGQGELLGNQGNWGTVDYDTGAITINFDDAHLPTDGIKVTGSCDVNVEAEPDMVTIGTGYDPVPISAEFFGLKTESGLLNNFSFSKRWGRSSSDEQAQDLANELTNTLNAAGLHRLISSFAGGANNTATYNRTPPSGISVAEHKLSFVDTAAKAEGNLSRFAGRGVINRYIAGSTGAATLRAMPGFVAAAGGAMQQIGLYGTLDGIPVIRVTDEIANINRTSSEYDDVYGVYMGAGAFDTPLAVAPYLPIFVTGTMNFSANPLISHRAIGTMVGIKTVMDRYLTKIALNK